MGMISGESMHETLPLFRKLDCYSIPVGDIKSAIAFYEKIGHRMVWRDGNSAAGLSIPGCDAEIVLHTGDRPPETYFLVESVPEAIDRITAAGGTLVRGPVEIPTGLYASMRDPWGNPLVMLDFSKGMLATDEAGNVTGNTNPADK